MAAIDRVIYTTLLIAMLILFFVLSRYTEEITTVFNKKGTLSLPKFKAAKSTENMISGEGLIGILKTFNMTAKLEVLKDWEDCYFQKIAKYPQLSVLILKNDHNNVMSNTVVEKYFNWTADELLCENLAHLTRPSHFKALGYHSKHRCITNLSEALYPTQLEEYYFKDLEFMESQRYPGVATFLTQIKYGYVTAGLGYVISHNVKLVPLECAKAHLEDTPPNISPDTTKFFEKVFVISQYWGENIFHAMIEDFSRLGPYIPFLRKFTDIKIHISNSSIARNILSLMDISVDRIVTGNIRAHTIYLPAGTQCGSPKPTSIQFLSKHFRQIIQEKYPQATRNSVVLIQRSGWRRFTKPEEIATKVKAAAEKFGFKFELFLDKPLPAFTQIVSMFNRAALVVGPHGAGLSNVIFTKPGTFVIEGVCNKFHTNFCYQHTIHVLGHRYHGIAGRGGCEGVNDVPPELIEKAALYFLKYMTEKKEHYLSTVKQTEKRALSWELEKIGNLSFDELFTSNEHLIQELQP